MTFKQSLISSVRNSSITREVAFILRSQSSKEQQRLRREICDRFFSVNKNLLSKLDYISKSTNLNPVRISIRNTNPTWPIFEDNIEQTIDMIESSNFRVIINFEDFDVKEFGKSIETRNEVTHLVEVSLTNHSSDLNGIPGPYSSVYVDSAHKVVRIIEDVMLDISMYYTHIDTDVRDTIDFRKEFSSLKVRLAKDGKLQSTEWDINQHKDYVAVAGYFWNNGAFDFSGYLDCWKLLAEQVNGAKTEQDTMDILAQLKRHKDFGELSISSITKSYNKLESGEYVMARLVKIPKSHKRKAHLLAIFGGSKLKRGKIRFFRKDEAGLFDNLVSNVSLFKVLK